MNKGIAKQYGTSLLLVILLFLSLPAVAQKEPWIRIVSFNGTILIDNLPVKSGQRVPYSKKLIIDKQAYAYVVTPKGYATKIGAGTWSAADIEDFAFKTRYSKLPPRQRDNFEPIEFIGFAFPPSLELLNAEGF